MAVTINEAFLKDRPLSYSRLKEFRKSPKHYIASFDKPKVDSDQMLIGSAVDCLLIDGEEEFSKQFTPYVKFEKRSNDAKAEWQAMVEKARTENKRLITNDLIVIAQECVKAVKEYPEAQPYLKMRKKHPTLRWTDKETKLPCIGKPDWDCLLDNQLCIVDLKTSGNADPDQFTRDAWTWEYFLQVGAYLDAYKYSEFQFPMFVFLVVETDDIHNVSINFVENKYAEFCREEWLGTLKAYKYCMDKNLWNAGYEFRLMDTATYFALRKPGYGKPLFGSWSE